MIYTGCVAQPNLKNISKEDHTFHKLRTSTFIGTSRVWKMGKNKYQKRKILGYWWFPILQHGLKTVSSMYLYIMGRTTFCKETSLQKASGPGQTRLRFLPYSLWLLRNTYSGLLSSPVDTLRTGSNVSLLCLNFPLLTPSQIAPKFYFLVELCRAKIQSQVEAGHGWEGFHAKIWLRQWEQNELSYKMCFLFYETEELLERHVTSLFSLSARSGPM